jgi:SAM-dependent methyltransferase
VKLPYRDFPFPLNVFVHILTREGGDALYLHYGLFESSDESLVSAQERSTRLLLDRLPAPPSRVLEVGIGLGTLLDLLTRLGYSAEGITPDAVQLAAARARFGESVRATVASLQEFASPGRYEVFLFQESSQYIDGEALFAKVRALAAPTARVLVLDEFALSSGDTPGALHRLADFLAAAERHGFRLREDLDVSGQAAPTVDYFLERIPRHREALIADLSLAGEQIDALMESGRGYRKRYASGEYGYRLLQFEA